MFTVYRATIHNPENFQEIITVEGVTFADSLSAATRKIEDFYGDLLIQVSARIVLNEDFDSEVIETTSLEDGFTELFDTDYAYFKDKEKR